MSRRKRRQNKSHKSFVMLPREMLRSQEWKKLSPAAKILYIYVKARYNGTNNGEISLHYSELRDIKGLSSDPTISRAFKELEEKDWIKIINRGGLFRRINEYTLTGRFDVYVH